MSQGPSENAEPGTPLSGSWERVSELFKGALERVPEERAAFLAASGGDEALLVRVRRLLAAHQEVEAGDDPLSVLASGLQAGRAAALLRETDPSNPGFAAPSSPSSGPSPGDQVGRYRVIRRLGHGGMGSVFEAHDSILDRSVALKFLPRALDDRARLLEEARAASALDHPSIGIVYELGEQASGHSFIAMASYSGGTLRDRLRGGPLTVEEAVRIGVQVAGALDAAHARGILHRDVKPENLLFDESGRIKLVDFGLARVTGEVDRPWATGGTMAYMSPEQLEGGPVDGRSDLWSLGVVLFEMLTGERPFRGRDRGALVQSIREGHPPDPRALRPTLDPALARVVLRALSRDPGDRFPTGKALSGGLKDATRQESSLASTFAGARGRRLGLAAAIAAAVFFGGGIAAARQGPRLVEARGFAGEAFASRGEVLVTEFQAGEGLGDLALATREALVVDLSQSGFVRVLPRARVEETLSQMGYPSDWPVTGTFALEVAERAGAGAVLETTVARAGTQFVLSGRAFESRSGEELFAVRTSAGERRLLGAVERLSREVRLRLGEAAETLAESLPLPQVTTASLEALRLYALAERAMAFDASLAVTYLDAALELDPRFAMAHRLMAATGVNRLRFEVASRHLELAWEHRDRLPDRERWLVEASRASETEYQPFRAIELYERIVARFPDEFIAWANLGNTRISWLHDPEGAFLSFQRATDLDPHGLRTLPSAAMAALILDRPEQADALMARAHGPAFEHMRSRWRVTRAFWHGDREELTQACQELLAAGFSSLPQADDREVCGSMYLVEGDLGRAIPALESVMDDYLRRHSFRNLASILQSLAMADLIQGDTDRARSRFLNALELVSPDALGEPDRFIFRSNLQIHAAYLGFDDVVERIGKRYPPLSDRDQLLGRGGEHLVRAASAVAQKDGISALKELEAAFPPGIMAMGWRTFDELLRGLAFELLEEDELAATHFRRAMNRGWASAPGMTKDRLNILVAEEGLARVEARLVRGRPDQDSVDVREQGR